MSALNHKGVCIGVDWGTSSFRAWLFDSAGGVLDSVQGPWGITQIADKSFKQILMTSVAGWLSAHAGIPIVMCGMIGSAQGWHEAGYLTGTVGIDELAAGVVRVPDTDINLYIIPGVQGLSADGHSDVMRGEETLLAGGLRDTDEGLSLFCLPGTHSKWIAGQKGRIDRLTTFMTGELFHLMRVNSVLSPLIDEDAVVDLDGDGFADGLKLATSSSGLSHQLFAIRAGVLTGRFMRSDVLTLLSAVLVGNECMSVKTAFEKDGLPPVNLMSSGVIKATYQKMFRMLEIPYRTADSEAAARAGLFAVFRRLSVV